MRWKRKKKVWERLYNVKFNMNAKTWLLTITGCSFWNIFLSSQGQPWSKKLFRPFTYGRQTSKWPFNLFCGTTARRYNVELKTHSALHCALSTKLQKFVHIDKYTSHLSRWLSFVINRLKCLIRGKKFGTQEAITTLNWKAGWDCWHF